MAKEATKALAALTGFALLTLGTGTAMVIYLYQSFLAQIANGSMQPVTGF